MGDTDFFGRVGELESLQDAYDSRIAEMAIIYGHRRIGKTALIQKFCEGKPVSSDTVIDPQNELTPTNATH